MNDTDETVWSNRIVGYADMPLTELLSNPRNWRRHPKSQLDALAGIFREVGIVQNLIFNRRFDRLVDGHGRVALARQEGRVTLPTTIVDLSEEEEALVLGSYDPIAAMAERDDKEYAALIARIASADDGLSAFFAAQAASVAESLGIDPSERADPGVNLDHAKATQETWGTERGQLWQVGRHRLICGDSTNAVDRSRLLNGMVVNLLHTDPPYGIGIVKEKSDGHLAVGDSKPFGAAARTDRTRGHGFKAPADPDRTGRVRRGGASRHSIIQSSTYMVIEGDDKPFDPQYLIGLAPIVILWGANYYADRLPCSSNWVCWDKREQITRNDFADCELAWCSKSGPARVFHHLWNGLHKGSQKGERRTHPTEKPVALFEEIGKLYAPKGIWLDLYAGTGAQMVAAERSGATCLALEIEPVYCAIILERMAGMGLEPLRIPY